MLIGIVRMRIGGLVLSVGAALACQAELGVPSDAQIGCQNHRQCPDGWTCSVASGRCIEVATNEPPAVTIDPIARVNSDVITVPVVLFEPEGDTVTLEVEVSDGGPFAPVTIDRILLGADVVTDVRPDASTETTYRLEWNGTTHFGDSTYRGGVEVRITPSDGANAGAPSTSQPFAFGDNPPRIEDLTVDVGSMMAVEGLAVVRITVADDGGDPVRLTSFEVIHAPPMAAEATIETPDHTMTGQGTAFPSGALADLATDPTGIEHSFVWDSAFINQIDQDDVILRVAVADAYAPSTPRDSAPAFTLDNGNSAPVITIQSNFATPQTGFITILYQLTDSDLDNCNVFGEYFDPVLMNWVNAINLATNVNLPPGSDIPFEWNSATLGNSTYSMVQVRLWADDLGVGGVGDKANVPPFDVDNTSLTGNLPPTALVIDPVPRTTTTVDIPVTVIDPDDTMVTLIFEVDWEGMGYVPALLSNDTDRITVAALPSPGQNGMVTWKAQEQIMGSPEEDTYLGAVLVRITPDDGTDLGNPDISAPFSFGNDPPTLGPLMVDVDMNNRGRGNVVFRFDVSDSSCDPVTITRFGIDGMDLIPSMLTPTGQGGVIPSGIIADLPTCPMGPVQYSLVWDSLQGGPGNGFVTLELTIDDGFGGTAMNTAPAFEVRNLNEPPTVAFSTLPMDPSPEIVSFSIDVTDNDGDLVSIEVEYETEAGMMRFDAAIPFQTIGVPEGSGINLGWDANQLGTGTHRARLHVRVHDGTMFSGWASTTGMMDQFFEVNVTMNNAQPTGVIERVRVPMGVSGRSVDVVEIDYRIFDADGMTATVDFQADGSTGPTATSIPSGLGMMIQNQTFDLRTVLPTHALQVLPSGTNTFLQPGTIELVAFPTDELMTAGFAIPFFIDVGNSAPVISLRSISTTQTGTVPLLFDLSDAEGDRVELTVEYSDDGGLSWFILVTPAQYDTGPNSSLYAADWDTAAFPGMGMHTINIRAYVSEFEGMPRVRSANSTLNGVMTSN